MYACACARARLRAAVRAYPRARRRECAGVSGPRGGALRDRRAFVRARCRAAAQRLPARDISET